MEERADSPRTTRSEERSDELSTPHSAVSHGESEMVFWNETYCEPIVTESRAL